MGNGRKDGKFFLSLNEMHYRISHGFKVKEFKEYPCGTNGKVLLSPGDVLTRNLDGTYVVHTGFCRYGIRVEDDEIEPINSPVTLQMA